jgi:uncharacterized phage protein gp47/JayE
MATNAITATGLTTKTYQDLYADFKAAFQSIYGNDINIDSDTPDGQMIGIFIQAILDNLDLITQVNNNFDPDKAFGVTLDQRVAYNGIQRLAGTKTVTNVTITTSQACTLKGLDLYPDSPFTVADNAGNQFQLQTTQYPSTAGVYAYPFSAKDVGAVLTVPNTITVPITVVLGVSLINNPTTYTSLGLNEETDAALKIRRQKSVALPSQGYLQGLIGALENINGITAAYVYENNTPTTDANGIPSHSIWVIVGGAVSAADVANAIYLKRNAGCGMKGSVSYTVTQIDGSPFVVSWDVVTPQNLFIKFNVSSLDGVNAPFYSRIISGLPTSLTPGVGTQVNINELATLVQELDPNTLVTNAGFSLSVSGSYTNTLSPTALNNQFAITSANIILLPIYVTPVTKTINVNDTQQLTAVGGHQTYTWSVHSGGGSVNGSGLYTAPSSPTVAVVRATDDLGNYGESTITVL